MHNAFDLQTEQNERRGDLCSAWVSSEVILSIFDAPMLHLALRRIVLTFTTITIDILHIDETKTTVTIFKYNFRLFKQY